MLFNRETQLGVTMESQRVERNEFGHWEGIVTVTTGGTGSGPLVTSLETCRQVINHCSQIGLP